MVMYRERATTSTPPRVSPNVVRRSLLGVELFSGMNALVGGVGLIINGLGIPESELAETPFDSFLVPGLLLSGVVGGSMLGAAFLVWKRQAWAGLASLGAGGMMLGWILIESLMIHHGRPLQFTIAALSVVTLALGWLSAKAGSHRL